MSHLTSSYKDYSGHRNPLYTPCPLGQYANMAFPHYRPSKHTRISTSILDKLRFLILFPLTYGSVRETYIPWNLLRQIRLVISKQANCQLCLLGTLTSFESNLSWNFLTFKLPMIRGTYNQQFQFQFARKIFFHLDRTSCSGWSLLMKDKYDRWGCFCLHILNIK